MSREEEGILSNKIGCMEHSIIDKTTINGAVENKKQIFILSIDLGDVFGGISYDQIRGYLQQIERHFPP
jgi:hypothetical protein